jgi:hypothetical protein
MTHGNVSSYPDYSKKMGLSFNKKIQSQSYQNTSVSIEGATLEWMDADSGKHMHYFGHWPNNSKQDMAATTRNSRMSCALSATCLIWLREYIWGNGVKGDRQYGHVISM